MSKLKLCTLYSGSTGNCVYISSGNCSILIDAGKNARSLCTSLSLAGGDVTKIGAIFITHEHSDHVSALETLSKKYHIPIHATRMCGESIAAHAPTASSVMILHPPVFTVTVGDMTVSSFPTSHDSACPVGYRVETPDETVGVATDTGEVTEWERKCLTGCRAVVIEANHDLFMLEHGPYPEPLKSRIRSRFGHLSNTDCAEFAKYLSMNGTERFLLGHLSLENNTPEKALDAVTAALCGRGATVKVASHDSPTFITE